MHSYNPGVDAVAKQFKDLAVQTLAESDLTQEVIADSLAMSQGTVSRWLAYSQDLHLPAFALAVLPDAVAIPLLSWIARRRGWTITKTIPAAGSVNGDLRDEAADAVMQLGQLLDDFRDGRCSKSRLQKHIANLKVTIANAEAEIEARS